MQAMLGSNKANVVGDAGTRVGGRGGGVESAFSDQPKSDVGISIGSSKAMSFLHLSSERWKKNQVNKLASLILKMKAEKRTDDHTLLGELWAPTFTYWEKLVCFYRAPITIFWISSEFCTASSSHPLILFARCCRMVYSRIVDFFSHLLSVVQVSTT